MSEKVARALGAAASTEPWMCNGKPCYLRPVKIKYLTELQRECLKQFRRSYLENYKDNMDLLGKTEQDFELKVHEVGLWDLTNLPPKNAYDPKSLVINEKIENWLVHNILIKPFDLEDENRVKRMQRILASALDNEMLKEVDYIKLTGSTPRKGKINYVSWWVTGSMEGMIEMTFASLRDQNITKEDIYIELGNNFAKLAELSREIESVTTPQVEEGNEQGPKKD